MMKSCWASILGGCVEKISREHIVSQALFLNQKIRVEGLPWCKNGPVEIGISSLTSKILCQKHNGELSPVDQAGAHTFDTLREVDRLYNVRKKLKPKIWKIVKYRINGILLERWFLKTLINLTYNSKSPIGRDSKRAGHPSPNLVRIAYGLRLFEGKAGLYSVVKVGEKIKTSDSLAFTPLIKDKDYIGGALFRFKGFRFLLFLNSEGPPNPLTGLGIDDDDDWGDSQLNFHNQQIFIYAGKHKSEEINFEW